MAKELVIDVEVSGALKNKGHPFDYDNKLVLIGAYNGVDYSIWDFIAGSISVGTLVDHIKRKTRDYNCYIGFNIKFDMHWCRRYGIDISDRQVWDCQLAEFILSKQTWRYPSLDEAGEKRKIGHKNTFLKDNLDKSIDVDQMDREGLIAYLKQDLKLTWDLYQIQKELIKPYWPLFNVQCQDLKVLADMEYNGMKYSLRKSNDRSLDCLEEENACKALLKIIVPHDFVNWSSGYHLSAILYGGHITYITREPVGTYKTGAKAGETRYMVKEHQHSFPRLVNPLKGSELAKTGYWSTAEDVLKELKATGQAKNIINSVLKLSELEKLRSTYYEGIPKKFKQLNWDDELMHGSINQCVARTGRTSSSNPNLQNIPPEGKECFVSRFNDD